MYMRFVHAHKIEGVGYRTGFLHAAYELLEKPDIEGYTHQKITDLLEWFKQNLDTPDRFNKTKSKGWYRTTTKGLSWFKPDAKDHISRAREIIAILEDQGILIETLRTDRVGYIVYEDDYQVVAEPFGDTPR